MENVEKLERAEKEKAPKRNPFVSFLKEWGIFILIVAAVILSRIFIWSLVVVDGHSMDPTLADKQRLVIVKTASIHRGDVVVAKEVANGQTKDIVKRVIGMPGDVVKFDHDKLYINGKVQSEDYLKDFQAQLKSGQLEKTYENYPLTADLSTQDRAYFVQLAQQAKSFTTDSTNNPVFQVNVPQGQYFLMGDNRIVSKDSRAVGPFMKKDIIGVVKLRIWPLPSFSLIK